MIRILPRKPMYKLLSAIAVPFALVLSWGREQAHFPELSQSYRPTAETVARWSLMEEVHAFRERLAGVDVASRDMATFLAPFLEILYHGSPTDFTPLAGAAEELIEALFETRLTLGEKLREFHEGGNRLDAANLAAIRDAFRAARFLEDFIAAEFLCVPGGEVLAGEAPSLLVNPRWRWGGEGTERIELRSGDLLLSRGNAVTSAAISRLALPPAQFSHLAIVYQAPESGAFYTVEAHIEIGSVVEPLAKYFQDGKVRAAVFRHPDIDLAHCAAEYMFSKVRTASATGGNIPYDFALDMGDDTALFCTEIAYWGYKVASRGRVAPPLYQSRLDPRIAAFHRAIGIDAATAFLPGDLECDTRFELIGEWRDVARIRENHMRDAVLSAIYQWMAEKDYRFHYSRRARWLARTVYPMRKIPWLGTRFLGARFPPYMGRDVFRTIVTLEDVAGTLEEFLAVADAHVTEVRGFGLTLPEAVAELEHFRQHDAAARADRQKTLFHHLLRASSPESSSR